VCSKNAISRNGEKIARVWMTKSYRCKGLASWMIENVANQLNSNFLDLGWEMPLTKSGKRFVRDRSGELFWGCGDVHSDHFHK